MRIVQALPAITYGDAVSNNAIAIDRLLRRHGYQTAIYAQKADRRIADPHIHPLTRSLKLSPEDILLYHLATRDDFPIETLGGHVIFDYHNITPAEFFLPYDEKIYDACQVGREQLHLKRNVPEQCLVDSEYNKEDLRAAGYRCPMEVCPILIPFEDYARVPNANVLGRYEDDWMNFLFVGRLAPNKRQEDIIHTFAWYKRKLNRKSRLFLVGGDSTAQYTMALKAYVRQLGVEDVIFTGGIPFDEILAYYRLADVFLCMSEHEGFCVPLLEAMYFHVPVVARAAAAVPDTLGDSGVMLADNDPVQAALVIHRLLSDAGLRQFVVEKQDQRLKMFSADVVEARLLAILEDFIAKQGLQKRQKGKRE